jgi:L-lactate dehydrogenase complex protein LldF
MQEATSLKFRDQANVAMADANLQKALAGMDDTFVAYRAKAVAKLPEFEALRDAAKAIKDHALANLDFYLERFADKVEAGGGKVHWCADAAAARAAVLGICRRVGARTATKGKTMIGEEIAINEHLEANGITPVETDLGEYIIQLRHETPSHLIAPAIHLTVAQVGETFREAHRDLDPKRPLVDPGDMLSEARIKLRKSFLAADVGITGANFLIAETGSTVIVTNEGNGDLTQILPRVHIVIASIEKVVPTLNDASTILRVLARSATGQEMSVYTTFSTGPRRPSDLDGPEEFHVVLLDNGRTALLGTEFADMLRCIRCGACMNHCVVYRQIGGHAYGGTYPGPMGSVLTPVLSGLAGSRDLPNACTMNGRCAEVCPVGIPLPTLLRAWRVRSWRERLEPGPVRAGIGLWAQVARRPALYRLATRIGVRVLRLFGRGGWISSLALAGGWTKYRDMPRPPGRTFMEQYRAEQARKERRP